MHFLIKYCFIFTSCCLQNWIDLSAGQHRIQTMHICNNRRTEKLSALVLIGTLLMLISTGISLAEPQSVTLQWQPSLSNGVVGYNLYRSQVQGSGYQKINSQLIAATSFTDNNVEPGVNYYYVCRAVTADGVESDNSNEASYYLEDTNTAPEAFPDTIQLDEDTWMDIDPLGNDYDDDGDPLEISSLTQPQNGTAALISSSEVRYTPDPDFNGQDTFTYTVADPGGKEDIGDITVSVTPVNDGLIAVDDTVSINEDTPSNIDILANDIDPDNEDLTVELVDLPSNGNVEMLSGGICRYTPSPDYFGTDSFSYQITDSENNSDTAQVGVTINSVVDGPNAFNDSFTTAEDSAMALAVLVNDSNPDGSPLTVSIMTQPSNGSAAVQADGTVLYTPAPDFFGTDYFTYSVADHLGLNDSAAVTVTVAPISEAFSASSDYLSISEDSPGMLNLLTNDDNPDNVSLTISIQSPPLHGQVELDQDGGLTYTPEADYSGSDSITYSLTDQDGNTSVATIDISISPVNDPPSAFGETVSTAEDEQINLQLLLNDFDLDNDQLTAYLRSAPHSGTVVISMSGDAVYTPGENFFGTDTFTYDVSDGTSTASAEVHINVIPVNDPPEASDDSAETDIGKAVTIEVLSNDIDPDGDVITASMGDTTPKNGTVILKPDGTAVYTPAEDFQGNDSFTYRIKDTEGETSSAEVTILVADINNPPLTVQDSVTVKKKSSVTFNVIANDFDPDGDTMELVEISIPANGTAEIVDPSGEIEYTPETWFRGSDRFTYTISDGSLEATGIISVSVLSRNSILKFSFPRSIDDGSSRLAETYIGVGIINPNKNDEDISFIGFDGTGSTRDVIQLGEKLPPQGQVALMTSELGRTDENIEQMIVEGGSGEVQGFFMIGDTETNRLDGVGGIQIPSRLFYFPQAMENEEATTLCYLVSENPEKTALVRATLNTADGKVLATKDFQIAPNGSLSGSIKDFFGNDVSVDNGYVKISSSAYLSGYEIIATDKSVHASAARSPQISDTLYAPHFIAGDGTLSIVRILNDGISAASGVITLMDDNGQTMISKPLAIEADRASDLDLNTLLAEKFILDNGLLTGSVLIELEGTVETAGTITMYTDDKEAVTTLPLVNEGMVDFVFPQVAQSSNRSIFTGFSIMNPGDQAAQAVISVYDDSGTLTSEKQLNIPPLHRITDLLNGEFFFGSGFSQMGGHIKLISDRPLVSVSIYGDFNGRYLSTVEGQPGEAETAAANAEMERILSEQN